MTPLFANRWLTALPPIWLVGAGAFVALVVAAAVYGLLTLVRPRAAAELRVALRDGFLGPLGWLLLVYAAVAVAFTPVVPVGQMIRSLVRMTAANDASLAVPVPADGQPLEIPLDLRPQELQSLELVADAPLLVKTQQPIAGYAMEKVPDISASVPNSRPSTQAPLR
jgi:hypothetical protein